MNQGWADQGLWEAVVAAERQVTQRRAEFYQDARTRRDTLATALAGSNWERGAALNFLQSLHEDVPDLLDQLVDLAISDSWSLSARQVVVGGRRDLVLAGLERIVPRRLAVADALDFGRLAKLLVSLEAWDTLHELVRRACASSDPETNEVGRELREQYGPMLGSTAPPPKGTNDP